MIPNGNGHGEEMEMVYRQHVRRKEKEREVRKRELREREGCQGNPHFGWFFIRTQSGCSRCFGHFGRFSGWFSARRSRYFCILLSDRQTTRDICPLSLARAVRSGPQSL
jgi:hypothetical protein